MKRTVAFAVCAVLLSVLCVFNASAAQSFSWYCVRNTEHKQPVADANMRFVEDYGGYYVDKKHGDDCEEKVVYLTFDAGYENGNVEKILDVLKQKQAPAAFFILTNLVVKNTALVKRMSDEGHLVCNHTSKHPDVSKYTSLEELSAELDALEKTYTEYTGLKLSPYFRPPEGRFSIDTLKYAEELGYKTVFWSFAYADWDNDNQMCDYAAKKKILDNIHNGAILLLHPTSETNAAILGDVIDELRAQGYRFGTLDELTA